MSRIDKHNNWSDAIRDAVKENEMPLDNALWSRIEATLDNKTARNVRVLNRKTVILSLVSSVAATIIIALFLYNQPQRVVNELLVPQTTIAEQKLENSEIEIDEINISDQDDPLEEYLIVESVIEPVCIEEGKDLLDAAVETVEDIVPQDNKEPEIIDIEENSSTDTSKESIKKDSNKSSREDYYQEKIDPRGDYKSILDKKGRAKTKLSLLYAGGIGTNSSNDALISRDMAIYSTLANYDGMAVDGFEEFYNSSGVSHQQPITVGLRVQYEVAPRLWLSSGLNYTQLVSNINMGNDLADVKQRIHLLGVPLQLNYRFLEIGNFSFYTGAGGRVEYCLGATVGSKNIDERDWHFSADANLGAEYSFNSWLGVYIEPSVSYYFTNTNLKSLISDSPTMFNFRVGFTFEF